jgi:branched-chain amino acid transport system permease protein
MRTISGPIVGSFIVFGIPELVLKQLPVIGNIDGLSFIFTGILIIGVVLFYPNGLIYLGNDLKKMWRKKKSADSTLQKKEEGKVNQNG